MKFQAFHTIYITNTYLLLFQVFVSVTSTSQNDTSKLISTHGETQANLENNSWEKDGVIPGWILGRRSKVLDKPLESQLNFHEPVESGNSDKGKDNHDNLPAFTTEQVPTFSMLSASHADDVILRVEAEKSDMKKTGNELNKSSSVEVQYDDVPILRVAGIQRQTKNVGMISSKINQKRRLRTKGPIRRQDNGLISIASEAPSVELTSVSPIESSFGGLTGLQSLPPLSFLQFVKLLVAVTPFMIPIVFVPLLILTIGIFMIPITRNNIFLDVGDLRSIKDNTSSSYMGSIKNFTTAVVMPRAYQFANEVVDHENCVERISCEISARYIYNEWNGSWRSIVNIGWISRIMNYLWRNHPTVHRIARSLDEIGLNEKTKNFQQSETDHENTNTSRNVANQCGRYVCQPKTLLRKYLS